MAQSDRAQLQRLRTDGKDAQGYGRDGSDGGTGGCSGHGRGWEGKTKDVKSQNPLHSSYWQTK